MRLWFWDITPVELTASVGVWMVISLPSPKPSAALQVYTPTTAGSPTGRLKQSSNGSTWLNTADNMIVRFTLYGGP
jgi:hypothetical protein